MCCLKIKKEYIVLSLPLQHAGFFKSRVLLNQRWFFKISIMLMYDLWILSHIKCWIISTKACHLWSLAISKVLSLDSNMYMHNFLNLYPILISTRTDIKFIELTYFQKKYIKLRALVIIIIIYKKTFLDDILYLH